MAMFGLLLALVLFGAFMRRKDFMTTMGISLAIVFPLLMIGLSAVSSLMSPRYFLPMAVGVLILLSAGLTATQNRWVMVTLSAFVIWFFANSIGVRHDEDYRYRIVAQVRFLESLGPGPFAVNVRGPALAREFRYNISKKTAIKANVKTVHGFEDIGEIPKGGVLWYQPNFIKRDVTVLLKRIPVVCEINVAKRAIYALARDRAHLPEAIRDCENLSK